MLFIWTRSREQLIQNLDKLNTKMTQLTSSKNFKNQYFFSGYRDVCEE